jgi:hypothetical protein
MAPVTGVGTWAAAVLLAAALSGTRAGARASVAVALLLLPMPAFVEGPPFVRFLLAVGAAFCFLRTVDLWDGPLLPGFLARARHLTVLFDTRIAEPRPPGFDSAAAARLALAGLVFLAALAAVRAADGLPRAAHYAVRWLAGGVMSFAGFEALVALVLGIAALLGLRPPVLHDRPYRSRSLAEFWGRRWNRAVSGILRERCFEPLARRSTAMALVAVFAASAAIHAYAAGVALGGLAAASWAAFFLAQPALIAAERGIGARRWPASAGRVWTLAVLAAVSPLFVEPFVRLFE